MLQFRFFFRAKEPPNYHNLPAAFGPAKPDVSYVFPAIFCYILFHFTPGRASYALAVPGMLRYLSFMAKFTLRVPVHEIDQFLTTPFRLERLIPQVFYFFVL